MALNNSNNSNNVVRNMGAPLHFGNTGMISQSIASTNHQTHLLSQSQPQTQARAHFPGHFQLSGPQNHSMTPPKFQAQAQSLAQLHGANSGNVSGPLPSSVSTPGSGSAKRASQKPHSRPLGGSSNSNTSSPFKTMEVAPAPRRKKQMLSDKQIPDKVAALLPESALYTQLLELETRVDSALARKKIDIQESLKKPSHVQKTLRIYVFNTFSNQVQSSDCDDKNTEPPSEPPSWSLKIVGRILEDGKDPVLTDTMQKSSTSYPKFSSFFKKITVYLDPNLYADNHVILWESARSSAFHEGFEVKRKGSKEFTAIMRLEMNHVQEKLMLSPALSEVLGIQMDTRARIIAAIWHYVKVKKLQNPNDPSFFVCDPSLQKVFGEERMKFSMVSQKISHHLSPPQPIHLEHKIKLSGNSPVGTTCYDVLVDVPFPSEKEMSAFLANTEKHKEIDACDELISASIKKIQEHHRRRAFFLGFSQCPAEFVNTLIASQSKDLNLAVGDASKNAEKECCSDFYNQSWVEDAVIRYLNRKSAGNDPPGST